MDDVPEQRKFLHDLANPLAIAQGNLRIVIDKLIAEGVLEDSDPKLQRLQKALRACQQMNVLIVERRSVVKSKISTESVA